MEDEADRAQHQTQVLKNAGLIGGLVFAALDTGGRPSVFWSGRRLAGDLADTVSSATTSVTDAVSS
jgi:hypothetical protein